MVQMGLGCHHHAIGVGVGCLQHRHPHDQTIVTLAGAREGAIVRVPAERDHIVGSAAHHDGVEDPDWSIVHQLGGRMGQRGMVEDITEVIMDSLWPLTECCVPHLKVSL